MKNIHILSHGFLIILLLISLYFLYRKHYDCQINENTCSYFINKACKLQTKSI